MVSDRAGLGGRYQSRPVNVPARRGDREKVIVLERLMPVGRALNLERERELLHGRLEQVWRRGERVMMRTVKEGGV
jgi:hypothetical protein